MTLPNYDYYGLLASTWDLWRDDTSQWADRFFFLELVKQYGQPVLDVGCGTGRILLDYLAQGIDVDGMDNSPEMLAICREKAQQIGLSPNLYEQHMETLDLPRTYRTILAPSSALQLVTAPDAARTALRNFFDHLQPGGAFVTPFSFAWREGDPLATDWELVFEKTRPEDGALIRRWSREWHEPEQQQWHAEDRFEVVQGGQVQNGQVIQEKGVQEAVQKRSPEGRWYTQEQAVALYREIGFTDIQLFHNFERTPAQPDDRLFCVLGHRPHDS